VTQKNTQYFSAISSIISTLPKKSNKRAGSRREAKKIIIRTLYMARQFLLESVGLLREEIV